MQFFLSLQQDLILHFLLVAAQMEVLSCLPSDGDHLLGQALIDVSCRDSARLGYFLQTNGQGDSTLTDITASIFGGSR